MQTVLYEQHLHAECVNILWIALHILINMLAVDTTDSRYEELQHPTAGYFHCFYWISAGLEKLYVLAYTFYYSIPM